MSNVYEEDLEDIWVRKNHHRRNVQNPKVYKEDEEDKERYKKYAEYYCKRKPCNKERDLEILKERFENDLSFEAIGRKFGLTGSRVSEIVAKFRRIACNYERREKALSTKLPTDEVTENRVPVLIEDLDPPVRVYNALRRAGIDTIKDLTDMTLSELNEVRNLGQGSIVWIIQALEKDGLFLKSESLPEERSISSDFRIMDVPDHEIGYMKKYCITMYSEIVVSKPATHTLIHKKVETLKDLSLLCEDDLLSISDIGLKTVKVLKDYLERAGLSFTTKKESKSFHKEFSLAVMSMNTPGYSALDIDAIKVSQLSDVLKEQAIELDENRVAFCWCDPTELATKIKLYHKYLPTGEKVYYSKPFEYVDDSMDRNLYNLRLTPDQVNNAEVIDVRLTADNCFLVFITTDDYTLNKRFWDKE